MVFAALPTLVRYVFRYVEADDFSGELSGIEVADFSGFFDLTPICSKFKPARANNWSKAS